MKLRLAIAGVALAVLAALAAGVRLGPVPATVDAARFASVTVTDRNGIILYEPLAASGARGQRIVADQLPRNVVLATIAAEDRRFFHHIGVDPIAIARAIAHDVRRLSFVEGGSTITQQTAKLLLGSRERSFAQKMRETVLALRLEHRDSKSEILATYLSVAPYGNGINGIVRASYAYFGCAPQDLTLAQAAFLASLPQRPTAFNPLRDRRAAAARQRYVLDAMPISAVERSRALAERVAFRRETAAPIAQHFVDRVLARPHGSLVRTTIDARLQRDVEGIIAANRDRLLAHGARSVAVAVLDNRTGQWLAWEGSGDYFGRCVDRLQPVRPAEAGPTQCRPFGGAIDGVIAARQPGSALKPFTYALAFEQGYTPATVLADVPSQFPTAEDGVTYEPRNYDGQYRGPLRVRAALAGSENVPAVAMLSKLGPASLLRFMRTAGLDTFGNTADYYGLGLTLGDAEVRLDQMIVAYAAFARGGVTFDGRRVMSQRTAFWISDILSDANAREFIFGTGSSLDFPFRVAVKTGTSQSYRDNWTVGYTRDVTVGVWVGNFDRSQLRNSSGVTGAAPIFNSVMLDAVKRARGALPIGDDSPIVAPPADVALLPVCALSGLRPSTHCHDIEREWLPVDAPAQFCSWHHDGYVNWPAEYRVWARAKASVGPALRLAGQPEGWPHTSQPESGRHARLIAHPSNGATYLIDPTLRAAYQRLPLRATTTVSWRVDARSVGRGDSLECDLTPGAHTIAAVDDRGQRDEVRIFVK